MRRIISSVEIYTPHRDQHRRWLTCGDLLSILRLLSLLRVHARPKSGQSSNQPHCQLGNWLVMPVRLPYLQVNGYLRCPWMIATDRLRLWRRTRIGHALTLSPEVAPSPVPAGRCKVPGIAIMGGDKHDRLTGITSSGEPEPQHRRRRLPCSWDRPRRQRRRFPRVSRSPTSYSMA
jgi:hypothetical protein